MQIQEKAMYKKKLMVWLLIAAVISYASAPILQQWLDSSLMFSWGKGFAQGFFNAYDGHVQYLDYPPLYFPALWFVGIVDKAYPLGGHPALLQLLLKIVPIAFYLLCARSVYPIACHYTTPAKAYYAAIMMLCCGTIFVNAAYWAQIDAIEIFGVLWFLYFFDTNRPYAGIVVFALCAVTKLQTLFFLPVLLGYLIFRYKPWRLIGCLLVGLCVGYACFLPFILTEFSTYLKANLISNTGFFKSLGTAFGMSLHTNTGFLLPFHLYLGSFNGYPFAAMNAFNFWSFLGLNMKPLDTPLIAHVTWLTPKVLGSGFLGISLLFPLVYGFICKARKVQMNLWVASLLSLQTIYMLGSKIHDRYQIIVLPLLLILYVKSLDKRFGNAFIFVTLITFINHLTTIIYYFNENMEYFFLHGMGSSLMIGFSFINLLIYAYTIYISLPYLFKRDETYQNIIASEETTCVD